MQFANYPEFRTAVIRMMDGDDIDTTFSLQTLDMLIALGESRIYDGLPNATGLRSSTMQAALSGAITGNALALPADCIELEIVWLDPAQPLEAVSEADMRVRSRWNSGGDARQYAQSGDSIIFLPEQSDGTAVGGRYFQRPADIKDGLHSTFNRYPELFLYAALAESAPFIGEDARIPMWEAMFMRWLTTANSIERNRASAGSRLRQKVR